jgi:hypothetical protein
VGTRTASVTVAVGSAPDFSLSVTSSTPTLGRGGTTTVTVAAAAINLFTGSITVTAPTIAGVTFDPVSFSLSPGTSQLVTITASATAPLGTFVANFTGTAAGISGQRVASFTLTIGAEPPIITEVVPPAVARGVRSAVVRLIGSNFQPGAVVTGGTDLTIERTTVFSPTLAEIIVTTRSDAPPGPRRLDLRNPDGGTTPGGAFVLVYPESSLVAPFGVTAAAIVFPRPGSFVAFDEAVYPRGLLATTGTGVLIGSWLFDGVPFERFTAPVTGGHPIEVWSRIPIPISFAGRHELTLAVETPQQLLSAPVPIVQVVQRASRLKIYAPRDGAVIGKTPPLFRWSILPGASGYEVLFEDAPPALPKRIRVSQAEWRPTRQDLQQIGPGVHRWRVRAVFPVEVQGEPTPSQRVALLPESVSIAFLPAGRDSATGRTLLRWQGGSPGLLYRVDFFKGNERVPAFSALTAKQEYLLPAGSPYGSSAYRVRVTAYGPDGSSLGGSEIQKVPASAFSPTQGSGFQLAQAPVAVLRREPAEGAIVTTDRPRIAAQWSGAVAPDQIALAIDTTDVTAVSQMTPSAIAYEALVPLSPGPHTVRLSLAGALTSWKFTVQPGAPAEKPPAEGPPAETPAPGPGEEATEPAPSVPPEEAAGQRTDWAVTALGTLTVISGNAPDQTDDARAQLSSQGDLGNESLSGKLNGDISWRHQISEPQSTIQESRSWLVQAAAQQGKFRQEAAAGYAAPSFLDQTELMTAGLARGGIEGRFLSPAGSLAYYETFDSKPAGVVAGNSGPEQKIRVGAFSTPGDPNRFLLRAIALKVEDSASEFSPGGEGEAFGLFGKFTLGPAFSVLFEGARGDFKPRAGSTETERRGYAYRLALLGTAGTFSYNVNARLTEADFVNPANRGFTPGGIADRRGGDISLTKAFGRTSLALQYRHLEGGNSSGSVTPDAREDGGSLTVNTGIGSMVTISASGNVTADSADADAANQLPRTDRTQSGWTVTVNETPGAITFSQAFAYQRLRDEVNPSSDTTVKTASINAAGALGSYLNLSGIISGTRSDGIPQIGRTDQILLSLQPSFAIPALSLSLQPRASYTRSENEVTALDSRTEQYQFMLLWAPTWAQSLVNLQFSADWNRTRNKGQIGGSDFVPRYASTLTLRWGAGRGPAAPGGTVLPGETPIEPSSEAAAMQAGDTTATPAPTGGGP